MFKKSNYSELLRDPRWQKMRLQILERDQWKCTSCANAKDTLHVHHRYYENGRKPWEYPINSLATLCANCHENETICLKEAKSSLVTLINICGFTAEQTGALASVFGFMNVYGSNDFDVILSGLQSIICDKKRLKNFISDFKIWEESKYQGYWFGGFDEPRA